jgi:putative phosphoesterase
MRIGVVSDVHANLPALEAVLAALSSARVERVVHAGDVVGYGPWPNECAALLRDVRGVAGNHDLAVLGRLDYSRYDRIARRAIDWTREALTPESRAYLEALPARLDEERLVVTHGSLDSPEDYVRTPAQADAQLARVPGDAVLVLGHTHHPLWHRGRLLNPGAVGQSRDGRLVAYYALLDLDAGTAELKEVPYDVARVRRELRRRGLPPGTYRWPPSLAARVVARLR